LSRVELDLLLKLLILFHNFQRNGDAAAALEVTALRAKSLNRGQACQK
jgi:hypothetical protein